MKTDPPELDVSMLLRATLWLVAVGAFFWLLRLLGRRKTLQQQRGP
jgi:hypothetical protein